MVMLYPLSVIDHPPSLNILNDIMIYKIYKYVLYYTLNQTLNNPSIHIFVYVCQIVHIVLKVQIAHYQTTTSHNELKNLQICPR